MGNEDDSSTETPQTESTMDISDDELGSDTNPEQASDRSNEPDAEEKAVEFKNIGNTFLKEGKFLDAIKAYSEGLEYRPTNAILRSNRALAFIKVENYGLALQDADVAISADPRYAKAYYRRASANFALNHFKLARKDFRAVCKLKPNDKDGKAKLNEVEKAIREDAFCKAIEAEQTAPLSSTYDPSTQEITSSYEGPHPSPDGVLSDNELERSLFEPGNLPREFVVKAMEHFKDQKLIHKRYVARTLLSCRKYFNELGTLMRINIPSEAPRHDPSANPRVTVCGDTHGQYYDVLNIFEINGMPDKTNPYLFNGDFVDRGSFSFEVIMILLLWKVYDPECIFLHRGNHETKNMNRIYGFEGEVKAKYDTNIFQLFLEVFEWLPLASVIGGKVFVTHGGIPTDPTVMLNDIANVKRGMEPPENGLMSDLLWSDPQPFPGKSPSKRGVGFAFGPDITENFLDRNNLDLLVRSHEVKDEGYLVEHNGKTITVFSAPNYCDSMGNKGAFIHFDESMEPKFTQYEHSPHPDIKPMAYAAGMGGLFA